MNEDNSEDSLDNYEILDENIPTFDLSFKIIVIGDSGK
jgi:hypothetical protein